MRVSDSISSLLTTIRTGQQLRKLYVIHYSSKILIQILNVLIKEGYLCGYSFIYSSTITSSKLLVKIFLKYTDTGLPVITSIVRVSKTSQRFYFNNLNRYVYMNKNSLGMYILSTPFGIISSNDAFKQNIGGEILCKIF